MPSTTNISSIDFEIDLLSHDCLKLRRTKALKNRHQTEAAIRAHVTFTAQDELRYAREIEALERKILRARICLTQFLAHKETVPALQAVMRAQEAPLELCAA